MAQSTVLIVALFATFLGSSFCQHDSFPVGEFSFKCELTGFFPDPDSKPVFYECVRHPFDPTSLIAYSHHCGFIKCYDQEHTTKCSLKACSPNLAAMFCLRDQLKQDAKIQCGEETLAIMEEQLPAMMDFTAHRGDAFKNFRLSLRDMNTVMRRWYLQLIENTGKNVFPLMVATDTEPGYEGVGGVFKIYFKDGSMRRIVPVGPIFEINKGLSHVVMTMFSVVSPYFSNPNSINWQQPLRDYQGMMRNVEYLLQNEDLGISSEQRTLSLDILKKTNDYIDNATRANSADAAAFSRYANDLAPLLERSMEIAAKAHAEDTIPALLKLKEEMGEEEWKKMFVIIPTIWPVSLYNIRMQALEKVISFEQIESQLLITEGARTEDDAKTTLGRIVTDRALAQLIWGGLNTTLSKDHIFSVSTRRDLLSTAGTIQLREVCRRLDATPGKPKCPFAGRTGNEDINT